MCLSKSREREPKQYGIQRDQEHGNHIPHLTKVKFVVRVFVLGTLPNVYILKLAT